jgi:hypothetical protein
VYCLQITIEKYSSTPILAIFCKRWIDLSVAKEIHPWQMIFIPGRRFEKLIFPDWELRYGRWYSSPGWKMEEMITMYNRKVFLYSYTYFGNHLRETNWFICGKKNSSVADDIHPRETIWKTHFSGIIFFLNLSTAYDISTKSRDLLSMSADYHPQWWSIIPSGWLSCDVISHHGWYSYLLVENRLYWVENQLL